MNKCCFYPSEEELDLYGPFCEAGSEISARVCTKEDEEECFWANELKEEKK